MTSSQVLWKCPRVDAVGEDAPHGVYVVGFPAGSPRPGVAPSGRLFLILSRRERMVRVFSSPKVQSTCLPAFPTRTAILLPWEAVQEEDHGVALQAGCGEVEAGGTGVLTAVSTKVRVTPSSSATSFSGIPAATSWLTLMA